MSEHIVQSYDNELNQLQLMIAQMGTDVCILIGMANKALLENDLIIAKTVIEMDRSINQQEQDINIKAQNILALRAPMASDLRGVLTSIQMASNLERAGDLGKNIAKIVRKADLFIDATTQSELKNMAEFALKNLELVISAYNDKDEARALQIYHADRQLDKLYGRLFESLMNRIREKQHHIDSIAQLLFVSRHLERIGDHGKNIAEATIYMVTGDINRFDFLDDKEN